MMRLAVLGLLGVVGAAWGQQGVEARLEKMRERLKLSEEQVGRVRPVLEEQVARLREMRGELDGGMSRREKRKTARAAKGVVEDADEKLKKILTKAQMEELKKMRAEAREAVKGRRLQGGAGA